MASSRSLPLSGFKAHQVLAALAVSMALHAGLLAWMLGWTPWLTPQPPVPPETIVMIDLAPPACGRGSNASARNRPGIAV